jgi:hypothetical protein
MTIAEAAKQARKLMLDTGASASDAVKALWPSLGLDEVDIESLAMSALSARAGQLATSGKPVIDLEPTRSRVVDDIPEQGYSVPVQFRSTERTVAITRTPVNVVERAVLVLHHAQYNINGKSVKLVDFGPYHLSRLEESAANNGNGFHRLAEFCQLTRERLAKLKKNSIRDLAQGEQEKIARNFWDIKNGISVRGMESFTAG